MKKYYHFIILIFAMAFILSACTAKAEEPVMNARLAAAPVSSEAPAQRLYLNEKFGFSFVIPDSWESENYDSEAANKVLDINGVKIKYTAVSFIFQGDTENPLLTIQVIPKKQWDSANKKASAAAPDYLGTNGNFVYCYTLPQTCPYDVGTKADLYNSMVLLRDDVPNRFKILNGTQGKSSGNASPDSK